MSKLRCTIDALTSTLLRRTKTLRHLENIAHNRKSYNLLIIRRFRARTRDDKRRREECRVKSVSGTKEL